MGKYQPDAGALNMEWMIRLIVGDDGDSRVDDLRTGAGAQGPKMVEIDDRGKVVNSSPLAQSDVRNLGHNRATQL